MRKKIILGMVLVVIAVAFVSLPANAADDTFEYIDGPTGGAAGTILYYEVAKDIQ